MKKTVGVGYTVLFFGYTFTRANIKWFKTKRWTWFGDQTLPDSAYDHMAKQCTLNSLITQRPSAVKKRYYGNVISVRHICPLILRVTTHEPLLQSPHRKWCVSVMPPVLFVDKRPHQRWATPKFMCMRPETTPFCGRLVRTSGFGPSSNQPEPSLLLNKAGCRRIWETDMKWTRQTKTGSGENIDMWHEGGVINWA